MSENPRLNQIRVVLVEPKQPGNIGSVARAMKNMGLSRLFLVSPADHTCGEARQMAHGSGDILYNATVTETLQEALSGTSLTVGTTHKKRRAFDFLHGPQYAAQRLTTLPPSTEGALVFGREERGLKNDELLLCQVISQIPSAVPYPSLNLAQAMLIFGYELHQAATSPDQIPELDLAQFEQVESMYDHISSALDKLGFVSRSRPEIFARSIRRLFGRIQLEKRDVNTVHKIFSQVDKFVSRHEGDSTDEE